jgi:hypothetical protein
VLQLQDIQVRQTADGILCEQESVVHLYLWNSTKFTFGKSPATFTLPPGFSLPLTRTLFVDSGMWSHRWTRGTSYLSRDHSSSSRAMKSLQQVQHFTSSYSSAAWTTDEVTGCNLYMKFIIFWYIPSKISGPCNTRFLGNRGSLNTHVFTLVCSLIGKSG